jgi:hypothetical protein
MAQYNPNPYSNDPAVQYKQYPANPYINPPSLGQFQGVPLQYQQVDAGAGAAPPNPTTIPGGGYYKAPGGGGGPAGYGWAKNMYSPDFLNSMKDMYGQYQKNLGNVPNLAGQYQQYLQQSPELEQMQYNQALARLKGQMGTAQQQLMAGAGARRGGGEGGWLLQGQQDLNRQLMSGTSQIAAQQAMQNLADQERRMQQYLGYQQGDWANQQGALGASSGWLNQMMPFEQFNIQWPQQYGLQQGQLGLARSAQEEQINAARRAEQMGWLDRLLGLQGQLGGQYYQGQGDWENYKNMQGGNVLQGYTPQWLAPYGM